jgi:protein SCO1
MEGSSSEHSAPAPVPAPAPAERGRAPLARVLAPIVVLVAIAAGLSLLLLRGSSAPTLPGGAHSAAAGHGFYGTLALPSKPAPAIALHNYLGRPVTLAQYRGRAVLVTFLYAHCPDVCPLIASNLRLALNELGAQAARVQVIAVSVDPGGDTPSAVGAFLRSHQIGARMQYLIGSAAQLGSTWSAWSVGSEREAGQPDRVAHSALVYGVSASGRLTTIYPASFEPAQIVHDVPLLAER